ncbi:MAG: hypothetical protein HFJ60_09340 [Clostridia bacterium]|jgi:cell division protein FtsL|nr:hypothetical protein [Clostridia bacterium]
MAQEKYQYGTTPRKFEPDYNRRTKEIVTKKPLQVVKDMPKQQVKVSGEQKKRQMKITVTVIGVFLLLLTISCRNSQIDKKFNQIQEQKKILADLQKENEQLRVSIENSQNLSNIEKVAKEELGMQKLTNKQIVYVSLPKKDYIETASEKVIIEDEKNWLEKLLDKFLNM